MEWLKYSRSTITLTEASGVKSEHQLIVLKNSMFPVYLGSLVYILRTGAHPGIARIEWKLENFFGGSRAEIKRQVKAFHKSTFPDATIRFSKKGVARARN